MGWVHNPARSPLVLVAPLMARMMTPSPLLPAPSPFHPYQRKMWWMPVYIQLAKLALQLQPCGLPLPPHPASGLDSYPQGMPGLCPPLIMLYQL